MREGGREEGGEGGKAYTYLDELVECGAVEGDDGSAVHGVEPLHRVLHRLVRRVCWLGRKEKEGGREGGRERGREGGQGE